MKKNVHTLLIIFLFLLLNNTSATAQCEALFTFDGTDLTIQFIDLSTSAPGDPIVSWFWDFDDGTTSTEQNPLHTFSDPDSNYDVVLTITTQNGCTANIEIRIEICVLNTTVTLGDCDANDEVLVTVNVSDVYDNAVDVELILDGVILPGGPYPIDVDNPLNVSFTMPGDGLLHTLTVQSDDIPTCNSSLTFTVPDCSSNCFLGSMQILFSGGTTANVNIGDNFFSPVNTTIIVGDLVHFVWVGDGHSTTSDATSGPDSWNSGVIGAGSTYDLTIINPGIHPFYCIPHGGPNGSGMSGSIVANCPSNGQFILDINFNTTVADAAGYNLLIDGVVDSGSPYSYNGVGPQTVQATVAGDGQLHTFEIQDVNDPTCTVSKTWTAPDCGAAPACSLSLTATQAGGCDANNEVDVTLTVNSINGGASGFNVLINGNTFPGGPFPYDASGVTNITIQVPGTGTSNTIEAIDVDDPACTGTVNITTTDCTIACAISNLAASTGSSNTQVVLVEDFAFNPANITITDGDIIEWQWVGAVDHTSTSDAATGADSWDSGLLANGATYQSPVLSAGVHPYYCIPHGDVGGVGMSGTITVQANCTNGEVSVALTFDHTGGSFNGFDVLVDSNNAGTFSYDASGTTTVTVNVAGDGQSHTLQIVDADDPACTASVSITTPDCNAPTCQITASAQESGGCDANDNVPVDVTVTHTGGGASGFQILVDGVDAGTFPYGATSPTTVTIDVTGDGLSHNIEVIDIDEPTCSATTTVTTSNCVIPCNLSNLTASTGSSNTQVVLVEDFAFNPANITITDGDIVEWQWVGAVDHTSTSDAATGADSWDSGLLANGATYQSPVLSAGVHPYYCIPHGDVGGVGMSGTITVQANCTNGEVSVALTFDHTGGSFNGFDVLVDSNNAGTFSYDASGTTTVTVNVAGDGQSHTLQIVDADDPACTASVSITTPDCNAPTCQITASAQESGGCDANDNVPVDVTVTHTGGGASGFQILVDGVNAGTFPYGATSPTTVTIDVTGDGLSHNIEVIDIDEPTCSATTTVTTSNCVIPCNLSNLTASTGSSNTQVVLVEDFAFNPANITITDGDIVEWQWVGAVDHTSTSDAATGADSWDSGLLANGATYQSPVLSAGVHPYYCIPHGDVGGVGMSGTITVQANCTNGEVSVALTFDHTGGSFNGFDVLVDGNNAGTFSYDASGTTTVTVNVAGDGQSHTLQIVDADDPACTASVSITTPDCNAPTCQLTASAQESGGCDANDNVPVDVTVTHTGGGASGFQILVDGVNAGTFPYGATSPTTVTIDVTGDGLSHNIEVIDIDEPTCSATTTVTTTNCIIPCNLSNLTASTGSSNTQVVLVEDFAFNSANITITDGDIIEWQWVGAVDHTSTSDAATGADSWDSGLLANGATYQSPVLSAGVHPYYCIPHGDVGGVGMSGTITVQANCTNGEVSVALTFDHTGGSFNGFDVLVDSNNAGTFSYDASGTTTVTVNVAGDGQSHTLQIVDADDPACTASVSITTPDCNAPTCQITASAQESGGCDANDNVPVDVTVTHTGGGASGFQILVDGVNAGTFPYGATSPTTVTIDVAGDGLSHNIEVIDIDEPTCSATTTVTTTNCVIPCNLSNLTASTGSSNTQVVLVEDFAFNPANITITDGDIIEWQWVGAVDHTSTSDAATGADSWDSGLLANGATYQSPVLSAGVHPYYCIPHGDVGGVGMSGTITVQANCTNGEVSVALTFNESGGSFNGFSVLVDGNNAGTFSYDASGTTTVTVNVAGDGQSHTLQIVDADDPACTASVSITTPDCNAPTCQLTASAQESGGCDANDNVPVDVTVTHTGGGASGFQILVDGVNAGTFPYGATSPTTVTIDVAGDGLSHNIEVIDIDEPTCSATTTVTTTNCTLPCELTNMNLELVGGGNPITHFVEVKDFEFLPKDIEVNVGDIIHWDWTGVIDHTTTSDATTGADTWASALQGQGTTFETTITTEGYHPYYCEPHGDVGGIGMSGSITAIPAVECDGDGMVSVLLSFDALGAGNTYDIFIDGNLYGNFSYSSGTDNIELLMPGDGQQHTIMIEDDENSNCFVSGQIEVPECIAELPCSLMLDTILTGDCDPSGSIEVLLGLTSEGTSTTGFNIFVDGVSYPGSPFMYDVSGVTQFPISIVGTGGLRNIEIVDADSLDCSATVDILTPDCEVLCLIEDLEAFTGSDILQRVEVKDFEFDPPNLTVVTGQTILFDFTGAIPHTTTSDAITGPNSWDSGLLGQGDQYELILQNPGEHPYYCIPHGGPGGIGMAGVLTVEADCEDGLVAVEINFNVTNGSNDGYQVFLDGTLVSGSPFVYDDTIGANSLTIELPGDGDIHLITVQDLEVSFCAATVQVQVADCDATCSISDLEASVNAPSTHIVEVKDFEFFPKDIVIELGDTVRYIWTGSIEHTATSDATSGPDSFDSGLLGQGAVFDLVLTTEGFHPYYCIPHGGVGGIGMSGTITVENTNCQDGNVLLELNFTNTATGSLGYDVYLDGSLDGGSPFDYDPSGNNTISLLTPGDGLNHSIIVSDVEDASCADTISVVSPNCSADCSLSLDFVQTGDCNANNEIPFVLQILGQNTGTTFEVLLDGNAIAGNPYSYNTGDTTFVDLLINGDGFSHVVVVNDLDSMECSTSVEILVNDCTPDCSINVSANQTGDCTVEGELPYDIIVDVVNPGTNGFNLFLDGILFSGSPFSYSGNTTTIAQDLPGDGAVHEIIVVDADMPDCSDSLILTTIDCGVACNLENLMITPGAPETYVVDVLDFAFDPLQLTIEVGDTVYWDWIGEIPHTTTSDTISGDDTWNSGLLGQGASYFYVIQHAGEHPYYCIPHGSPGGIGMAANITAEDPCSDNILTVSFSFTEVNGSLAGYNVYVDGGLLTGGPFAYNITGVNEVLADVTADGLMHNVSIQDVDNPDCQVFADFIMPNCSDPCFGFEAEFVNEIDHINYQVDFTCVTVGPTTWSWEFGDGGTSDLPAPTYTYDEPGSYEVCVTVTNDLDCVSEICDTIVVGLYLCEPAFNYDINGLTIDLTDMSETTDSITNWIWDLGNGFTLMGIQNPSYTYPDLGIYEVCLTIETTGCSNDTCMTIDLSDPCLSFTPNYSYTINSSTLEVQFIDLTNGNPNQWLWGFGDGTTSTETNPSHIYDEPGAYNVCLLVQDTDLECNEAFCEVVYVGVTSVFDPPNKNYQVMVFPNPTTANNPEWTLLGFNPTDINQLLQLRIFDIHGKTIFQDQRIGKEQMTLSADLLNVAGVYFLELKGEENTYQAKLVIY